MVRKTKITEVPPGWHQDLLVAVEPGEAGQDAYRVAQRDRYLAAAEAIQQAQSLLRLAYDKLDGCETFASEPSEAEQTRLLRIIVSGTSDGLDLLLERISDATQPYLL